MNKTINNTKQNVIENGTATLSLSLCDNIVISDKLTSNQDYSKAFSAITGASKITSIETLTDLDGTVDKRFFFNNSCAFIQVLYDEDDLSYLRRSLKLWVKADVGVVSNDTQQEESIRNLLDARVSILNRTYERTNRNIQQERLSLEPSSAITSIEYHFNVFERSIDECGGIEELRCSCDTSLESGELNYWIGIDIEPEDLIITYN